MRWLPRLIFLTWKASVIAFVKFCKFHQVLTKFEFNRVDNLKNANLNAFKSTWNFLKIVEFKSIIFTNILFQNKDWQFRDFLNFINFIHRTWKRLCFQIIGYYFEMFEANRFSFVSKKRNGNKSNNNSRFSLYSLLRISK